MTAAAGPGTTPVGRAPYEAHYASLLAPHYTWMLGGDLQAAVTAQLDLLRGLGLPPRQPGADSFAIDLGAGPGPGALALARLGFAEVAAVDTSEELLGELARHAAEAGAAEAVRPVRADFRDHLGTVASNSAQAVLCLGDTLPHLPHRSDVSALLVEVCGVLTRGGSFVATYREQEKVARGTDRFLPVRSTEDRILTCFLEYVDEHTLLVHDLLHTRDGAGWRLETSAYPKLRLSAGWLDAQCAEAGLRVVHHETGPRGMRVLHAVRP
ncbi:class I SAM-dependent methyltransferase [Streptomyces oryzae]|uniref:Class I SAM-dependent methyltransferase n=1 Tax=Streptomyces oryzae TaxID=1434886 RepID=A0ABS3XJF6_9ACTN|nr:class I SAM-dependent methyltransferase [Streptomyces oryzae]MBO8195545.1 class I SAM-dependent methyltransferase [Streptomyces oryzae]